MLMLKSGEVLATKGNVSSAYMSSKVKSLGGVVSSSLSLPIKTLMVDEPMLLIWFRICCFEPLPSATISTTEAMPMMMPSMVRKVLRR